MGVAKNIPSLGALTPIESLIKGGSAKDVFSPKNWLSDTTAVLQKPSRLLNAKTLTGQGDKGGQTLTSQDKQTEKLTEQQTSRNFISKYGDAKAFRDRVDAGLQV